MVTIAIIQVHIMISIVETTQKHLIIVPIKFHSNVNQDVYQSIEYEMKYETVLQMNKTIILIIHVHKFNIIVYDVHHPS
jgi:hypothetical protein